VVSQRGSDFAFKGEQQTVNLHSVPAIQKCAILNRRQPCAFAMLHSSLGSKGFLPDQSLQKGNGRDTLKRCGVLLFGALSRTVFFLSKF
jgi:hypothetical protein